MSICWRKGKFQKRYKRLQCAWQETKLWKRLTFKIFSAEILLPMNILLVRNFLLARLDSYVKVFSPTKFSKNLCIIVSYAVTVFPFYNYWLFHKTKAKQKCVWIYVVKQSNKLARIHSYYNKSEGKFVSKQTAWPIRTTAKS